MFDAAVAWLEAAFGFTERVRIGESHRSQFNVGEGGAVIVADVRHDQRPPTSPRRDEQGDGARPTTPSAHCGARPERPVPAILMEPTDFEYGERQDAAAGSITGHQMDLHGDPRRRRTRGVGRKRGTLLSSANI